MGFLTNNASEDPNLVLGSIIYITWLRYLFLPAKWLANRRIQGCAHSHDGLEKVSVTFVQCLLIYHAIR